MFEEIYFLTECKWETVEVFKTSNNYMIICVLQKDFSSCSEDETLEADES